MIQRKIYFQLYLALLQNNYPNVVEGYLNQLEYSDAVYDI